MKTIPEFTEAEIHEMMDFKQVLALTEEAHRRSRKIVRGIVATVLITGLIGGSLFVYQRYSSSEPNSLSETTTPIQSPSNSIPPSPDPKSAIAPDTTQQQASPGRTENLKKKSAQKHLTEEKKEQAEEQKQETASAILVDSVKSVSVFLPAEPVDGYPALYEYFTKELRYPEQAIKDSIQGVTLVSFIINAQGTPEQVATDHLLGIDFENEAIRLIEHMPAWKPAQLNGSPVRSKLSVPITFKVNTNKTQRQP